jgi:hypothetical protein
LFKFIVANSGYDTGWRRRAAVFVVGERAKSVHLSDEGQSQFVSIDV